MARIYGERIVLREYQDTDLEYMKNWVNDPDITANLSDHFLYPHSSYETESFFKTMVEGTSANKGFVIGDAASLEYIGQIDLYKIDWKNRFASLAIVIGRKECLGKGYGSEAIRLLQRFAFEELNFNRLELEVYEYNLAAHKCYLKCGFQEEGRYRKKIYKNGTYWDSLVMSILKNEYKK
ncbi:GNAT family N-acetyltransferase [Paenibacillus xylanexedens]|uniref:GNAT family N-acetyltransferase n=1 Tax=Paenibacillus xylanexedens TaxID=528191 RepID=UPI0011A36824|nr:GNAT family protein [Paenibacillus xylanexedens]